MIRLDPTRRDEAIEAGWLAYRDRLPGMEAVYRNACDGWQVVAVVADRVIGALFAKDGVIHLGIVPEWRSRWASRRLIREMLGYGKRTTLLPDEDGPRDFISRIGFVQEGSAYVLNAVNDLLCGDVGIGRLFNGPKGAKVCDDSAPRNLCGPTVAVLGDAECASPIPFVGATLIPSVEVPVGISQVAEPVVAGVAVDVVDMPERPFASHVQPSKPVSPVVLAVNHNSDAPILLQASGNVSGSVARAGTVCTAKKDSCLGVVLQHLSESCSGQRYDIHGDILRSAPCLL